MNVIIWARVSSREQREGYSIDAQLRITRDRATREGWKVVREFAVAESAKRGAERLAFNEMFAWVKANARREGIQAILSHKLDRVCRNMRDAVRLQELEDACGVKLAFVDNQFGPGAAGALSFNVMAAVAQYYSDNLQTEVLKGMDEKVRQGWLPAHAPYGYVNASENKDEPIQPHPEQAATVVRIFQLYSAGGMTFQSLANQLLKEGHVFRQTMPRFGRTTLSYILSNRFYLGEIVWHGKTYPGKHKPLINQQTFDACRDILSGKNRRSGKPDLPLSGGLFHCAFCGQSITGERLKRRLSDGSDREYIYYRCANNHPGPEHPPVRWKGEDLEHAVVEDLRSLKLPSAEVEDWFRAALAAAFADLTALRRRQVQSFRKRQTELAGMQDRLLTAYLGGAVDEKLFREKSESLKGEVEEVRRSLERAASLDATCGETALRAFDWSQRAADEWSVSNSEARRRLLDGVSLKRTLSDVSLCVVKRKPFDVLAERLSFSAGRGDRI